MDDSHLPSPHNNFFHFAFSHASAVRSLIESHLPSSVIRSLDLDSLQLQKDSFVDDHLRESYSDLLYSVPWVDEKGHSRTARIYLLLEHKSQIDQMTCLQLLRYVVRIWEQQHRNDQPLCPVFPLVIYHGESPWTAPRTLDELLGTPNALLPYSVRFAFPILDLCETPDDKLAKDPFLQSVLSLLKYSRRRDLAERLETILRRLLVNASLDAQVARLKAAVFYILASNPNVPVRTLTMTVQKILPSRIEPGSIADQLLNEGKQKGRIEGRTEGRTEGRMEGRMEGRQEGLLEGFIQGEIRLIRALQKILGVAVSDADSLSNQSLEQLQALSRDLQAQAEKPKNS